MKNYLRTQNTLYEEDKKEAASMRCSLLHGSWDQIPQRRPSVTPFSQCCCHCIIMKFSWAITNDRCDVHAKGQGQRSRSQVKTPFSRLRTVTPVWIDIWWWNDAQSLILLRRGTLLFFKVIRQFQGHTAKKIVDFDPNWVFLDCNSSLNTPMALKWCTKLEAA